MSSALFNKDKKLVLIALEALTSNKREMFQKDIVDKAKRAEDNIQRKVITAESDAYHIRMWCCKVSKNPDDWNTTSDFISKFIDVIEGHNVIFDAID